MFKSSIQIENLAFLLSVFVFLFLGCEQKQQSKAKPTAEEPTQKIDAKKFEGIYRSGKQLDSAITMGVNLQKYNELVQNFGTELSILRDRIDSKNKSEVELAKKFELGFNVYKDCLYLWRKKIEDSEYDFYKGNIGYCTPSSGAEQKKMYGDYICDEELKRIVEAYKIPIKDLKVSTSKAMWKVIDGDIFKELWTVGKMLMDEANKAYMGQG